MRFPLALLGGCALALINCLPGAVVFPLASPEERPRVIVLTDISNEPDDEESLVRLLVYANEMDLEGLIATTSVWLQQGPRPDLILRTLDAYAQVRPQLLQHAAGFPDAEALRSQVKAGAAGFGMAAVGPGRRTAGSSWLEACVDRADPRPLWVSVWGGANTLAQTLYDVRAERTPEALAAFVAKLRVYAISDQDDAGAWVRAEFPSLMYIVSPTTVDADEYHTATWTGISGDRFFRNGPELDFTCVENEWLREHIREGHGPLGRMYPKYEYIMEGDTPAFLGLVANGLDSVRSPDWGGWGGRYEWRRPRGETRPIWTNSRDTVVLPNGTRHTSDQATIWRWRRAFQHDFAARLDWCVRSPAEANHPPQPIVDGQKGLATLFRPGRPGEPLRVDASASLDPDGDPLAFRWFFYAEAGPGGRRPPAWDFTETKQAQLDVVLPHGEWRELHLILEVTDQGTPALTRYRRLVVQRSGP